MRSSAATLPEHLAPPEPFPRIIRQAPSIEPVAPGVTAAEYDLVTGAGPIVANVVSIEPSRKDVVIETVLASDALTSNGETISSMARRTNAVAGINADYFDIGNTNRPTNIVVRDGRLLRTPRKRYSLVITRAGSAQIIENAFTGTLDMAGRNEQLDAVNELPPPGGGISLITPEFGEIPPQDNVTLVAVTPMEGAAPFTTYRVDAIADNSALLPPGYYVAIGLNAYGNTGVPNPGDTLAVSGDLTPLGISQIAAAVGGGPLILQNGDWYDDPDGPSGGEYSARGPASGAAIEPDGTLLLLQIDGRQPDRSVGITRPEFAAFMRAFGSVEGLAFDGGGSSEIALRALGTRDPQLRNHPSDGPERPVADGIFVYSMAPYGPAHEIVARPQEVRALVGAAVNVTVAAIDRSDHAVAPPEPITASVEPESLGTYIDGTFRATGSGIGSIVFRSGSLAARLPIDVFVGPSRLQILPEHLNVPVGGRVKLSARAFDPRGFPVAMPTTLPWRTSDGRIADNGILDAGAHDANVSLTIGAAFAATRVTVGSHDVPLGIGDAHFLTVPRGGAGTLTLEPGGFELNYALGPNERAAYGSTDVSLPQDTVGLAFDVRDDGSGAKLRLSLRNALNEQILVPATTLDRPGWRHIVVSFPQNLGASARLSAIYVIGANSSVQTAGSIAIRGLSATVAGSP